MIASITYGHVRGNHHALPVFLPQREDWPFLEANNSRALPANTTLHTWEREGTHLIHSLEPITLDGPLTYRLTPNSLWVETTFIVQKNRLHTVLCLRIFALLISIVLLAFFLHIPNRFTLGSLLVAIVFTIISFLVPLTSSPS